MTINPDGSGEQILSAGDPGSTRATRLEEDRAPSWSPDSARLVFMTQNVDPCCTPWQIVEVGRDGTGLVTLSDNPDVNDLAPAYSPDGTLIVFTSDRDADTPGEFDVYTMPAPRAGTAAFAARAVAAGVARLTTSGNASDPHWGRDSGSAPPPDSFKLKVKVVGAGTGGRVVSSPAGIECKGDCAETYPAGTVVELRAVPERGSKFSGWSGACTGTSLRCVVTMEESQLVRGKFRRRQ